jgi:hypothetical protein
LRKKNEYRILGGYDLLSESGEGILNSGFMHLRHNFRLTGKIKTFEFYQLQFNDVLLLNKREVFGAGLRIALITKDSLSSNINLGLMRELEVLDHTILEPDELAEIIYLRATFTGSIKLIISKTVRIDNIVYYQPYLKDFSDYRLLNEFNLAVSLQDHVELITSLSTRFDSKPPGSLNSLDNLISLGFNLKF